MVLGCRGYSQLQPSVRKTLSAKDTPLLPQPQQQGLYLYWVGEGGDAVRYATWKEQTVKLCFSITKELILPSPPGGATVLQIV